MKLRWTRAELMLILGLTRSQAYRMLKRCGAKRVLYLSQLRERMPEVWDSMVLAGMHEEDAE